MAARERTRGEWPAVTSQRQPPGYVADDVGTGTPGTPEFVPGADADRRKCRGSVEYDPKSRNYSFHEVTIEGNSRRIVRDCNFSFARVVIEGASPFTFVDCNLTGSRWHATDGAVLTFTSCNTSRGRAE